ncbi:MAG: hypothetical protein M3Y41_02020 [Pseudomonadota bacterium]|nr:hypothetical protein [Pseudomonadota bacterium]
MAEVTRLHPRLSGEDALWAVIAWLGPQRRIAEVFTSRARALADRDWREREVRAYASLLVGTRQPVPSYIVAPIKRSDLPRRWTPLPALGFLRL